MTITAKYAGTCRACGGSISVGDEIDWVRGKGAQHVDCPTAPQKSSGGNGRGPSRKQINYAMQLIRRLASDDYGTLTTFGLQSMTEARIEKMSSREVSDLIELVKRETY